MRTYVLALVALGAFPSSDGCRKLLHRKGSVGRSSSAPEITTPPTPVWKDHEFTFAEGKGRGSFSYSGAKLDITVYDMPPGTIVSAGTQRATTDIVGSASLSVDLWSRIGKMSPRDAFDYNYKVDPQTKLELDFGKNVKLTLDAPADSVNYGLSEAFKRAADTPLSFPPPPAPPAEHTILFFGSSTPEPMGPATTVDAIDWVALVTNLTERSGRTCGGYRKSAKDGKSSEGEKSYVLQLVDQKVSLYDARSTHLVATKDFKAKDDCPMIAFDGKAKTYASTEEQKTWLREIRARK